MRLRTLSLLAILATTAVIAAGCGGSSNPSPSSAKPSTTAAATTSGAATVKTASAGDLGTILVDSTGRTLYLWKADHGSSSTCSGACASAWPPVTTTGTPKAAGDAKTADLGTTKRGDGTTQVTYHGHPLYLFAGDSQPGDTTGEGNTGFGAAWYVVTPQGSAVDKS